MGSLCKLNSFGSWQLEKGEVLGPCVMWGSEPAGGFPPAFIAWLTKEIQQSQIIYFFMMRLRFGIFVYVDMFEMGRRKLAFVLDL